ncbi:OmpA family protein [Croceicoccus gelatinilyticus]|uniref:OmpA family protein n=1 Tax=Croceicoccus gelatinilyticus TaxID=2835536 RepID=UPI001BCD59F5|nr:OmpA family protein [Croceicoccus gelatinilyticus]MBS7669386.1 OmpA family protein [Croceicoccus gelatinilyticus]
MKSVSMTSKALLLAATLAVPATGAFAQQVNDPSANSVLATVNADRLPSRAEMTEGPEVEGIISARAGDRMQVTASDGTRTVVTIDDETDIKSKGGFLGLSSKDRAASSLFNGLPVKVKTMQYANVLVADEIRFSNDDLETAAMIFNGTDQRFAQNEAATEALRGRMGDIDKYNIKSTTNVYFDTGRWNLSAEAENELCTAANQAEGMDNALLLVVGYTDSDGSQDYNQELSEKRAGRVVNYLQQACGWKPYRMLTPTGMSEADPAADNETEYGKAQNRRVAVNVLVSKGLDGL